MGEKVNVGLGALRLKVNVGFGALRLLVLSLVNSGRQEKDGKMQKQGLNRTGQIDTKALKECSSSCRALKVLRQHAALRSS